MDLEARNGAIRRWIRRAGVPLTCAGLLAGCPSDPSPGGGGDDDSAVASESAGLPGATPSLSPVRRCREGLPVQGGSVRFVKEAEGLVHPLVVLPHPTRKGALLVAQRDGRVVVLRDGRVEGTFLDLSDRVYYATENGLLGFALSPDFTRDGLVYVHFHEATAELFDSVVAELAVSAEDPETVDPGTARDLLRVPQSNPSHNGGALEFGPDGMLYIALGDGGPSHDPHCSGSDGETPLGKILRIDPTPSGGAPYTVPADNPFVGDDGVLDEAWAWGLRNPWRFTFDRETGRMWIGDVGQDRWEEIDVGIAGAHYGWSVREGAHEYDGSGCEDPGVPTVDPVFEYAQDEATGASVTGGYVYRGCRMPDLRGRYFFADAVSGQAWSLAWDGEAAGDRIEVLSGMGFWELVAWGEDEEGELYLVRHQAGELYRMVPG